MQTLLGVNCMRGPCRAQLGGSGGPQADLGPWPLKVSKKHCLGAAILETLKKSKNCLFETRSNLPPKGLRTDQFGFKQLDFFSFG